MIANRSVNLAQESPSSVIGILLPHLSEQRRADFLRHAGEGEAVVDFPKKLAFYKKNRLIDELTTVGDESIHALGMANVGRIKKSVGIGSSEDGVCGRALRRHLDVSLS